jgi:hypothetical protein
MADNQKGIPFGTADEGIDYPGMAKQMVYEQALSLGVLEEHPTFSISEVYVVWFAYVLGNWKALCSTSLPDGRYYEVTYKASESKAFVDTYAKTHNVEVAVEQ